MAAAEQLSGSWQDWATDKAFRATIAVLRQLPYRQRGAAMDFVTRNLLGSVPKFQKRAETHLGMVFPQMEANERRRLARRALGNTGRTLIELYSGSQLTRVAAASALSGPGLDIALEAQAAKRPVLFVTGHFGNHEAPRHALVAKGLEIGGLYRPMSNPFFNSHYARTMTDLSGPVFEQGAAGTRGFLRHLKAGGMATLLFDVWTQGGEPIDFMGFPADTSLAAAQLATRTGALVIPYFGIRKPDGTSFDIRIEAPLTEAAPAQMMREATARLERHIHAHPEQYFWVHRRWKPL